MRGYELTGDHQYLDRGRAWAITGLPFVYQWSCRPVMAYATTPVFGATNWRAQIGSACRCNGAATITPTRSSMLMPYDTTLEWRRLAEGILIAAEQMQHPDGPYAGCVPDSFVLDTQTRRPWTINPCAIVSLRLAIEGKLDSLAVAVGDGHRVVSPFPVAICSGKAHIRAKQGITFQVLVDGDRVVDVISRGDDTVALDH